MTFTTTATTSNSLGDVTITGNTFTGNAIDAVTVDALQIREAATIAGDRNSAVNEDGTVLLHIIRPTVGKGKGRHLYEADMLARDAHKFSGWPQFQNHMSEDARKKLGGLPRPIEHLGGIVLESWWDGSVPADPSRGFEQGAVMGKVVPTPFVRQLIETHPKLVQASISATATSVKPVTRNGQKVWLVEGIGDKGSVDWVTEAGAGGEVVALAEAMYGDDMQTLEALTDDQFVDHLRSNRPQLLEALQAPGDTNEGGQMGDITPEAIQEAVTKTIQDDPTLAQAINTIVDARVEQRFQEVQEAMSSVVIDEQQLREAVEYAVAEERELIHAEARANADRQIDLRDMRDEAHAVINESRMPDTWKDMVKAKFTIGPAGPSSALDVIDEIDEEGNVQKSAREKLAEAVSAEISESVRLLASAKPTRVTGQGPTTTVKDGEKPEEPALKSEGTTWGRLLQEAGVDPDEAYAQ